jgi:hypothetical protein
MLFVVIAAVKLKGGCAHGVVHGVVVSSYGMTIHGLLLLHQAFGGSKNLNGE